MSSSKSRVFIGMPVYNGERHIRGTIESILNQTFSDFQLLISDNCSTDQTGEICIEYAQRDKRVIYHRQEKNLGMAGNFNYVVQPGSADYFKLAAYDDPLKPDYLRQCVALLDANPTLAMAHCPTGRIDDSDNWLGIYEDLGLSGSSASERFWRVLWTVNIYEVYGVARSSLVKKTRPVSSYFGSERNRLAEILLQGDIGYLEESLFSRRDHDYSLTAMHLNAKGENNFQVMQVAHAPNANVSKLQATSLKFYEYFESIFKFNIPLTERIKCLGILLEWGYIRISENLTHSEDRYREKLYRERKHLFKLS